MLPVHFLGSNGPLFQIAGLMHPTLRTVLLPRELLNKRNTLEMGIGHACPAAPDHELRRRTDWLKLRRDKPTAPPVRKMAPIGAGVPDDWVSLGDRSAARDSKLVSSGSQEIWLARANEIPLTLRELGRLREIAFRTVGEGTGHAYDLDSFDEEYIHLILWCRDNRQVQGAYRMTPTPQRGKLYTSTLFKFAPEFFPGRDRPLNSGAASSVPRRSVAFRHCCCCGAASASISSATPLSAGCSVPSVSAPLTGRRRAR